MADRPFIPLRSMWPELVDLPYHPAPHAGPSQSKPAGFQTSIRSKEGCWYAFRLSKFCTPTNLIVGHVEVVVRILSHPSKLFILVTTANTFRCIEVKCDETKPKCNVSSYFTRDHALYHVTDIISSNAFVYVVVGTAASFLCV